VNTLRKWIEIVTPVFDENKLLLGAAMTPTISGETFEVIYSALVWIFGFYVIANVLHRQDVSKTQRDIWWWLCAYAIPWLIAMQVDVTMILGHHFGVLLDLTK
jgi:hypothetical protein